MEKIRISGIESSLFRRVRLYPSSVILWITVIESVGQKKVDDLAQTR
jgi:hypothetical protein